MGVFEPKEIDARAKLLFEAYNTTLAIEAATLVKMNDSAIIPACAKDVSMYKDAAFLVGDRVDLHSAIKACLLYTSDAADE